MDDHRFKGSSNLSPTDKFGKDIFKDVKRIQEEMDLLFDHFYRLKLSPILTDGRIWRPPTDVFETENETVIQMEIAGMRQPDLQVTLSRDLLIIRGERKGKASLGKIVYQNMEINCGPFERNIRLLKPLDPDNVRAVYRDGFLEIRIPKKKGKASPAKEIKIEVD